MGWALGCSSEPVDRGSGRDPLADPPDDTIDFPSPTGDEPSSGGSGGTDGGGEEGEIPPDDPLDPRAQLIYLVMTDRFVNGDPSNDAAGFEACHDLSAPRRFHGGDLAGLLGRLDDLQMLGVTTVWITPVPAQIGERGDACGYHGYWAEAELPDLRPIEPKLGTEADLRALIEGLHERGMQLMVDLVVNHVGYGARLTATHPEWFHPAQGCELLGDPLLYCPLAGLPDLAQENPEVAAYLVEQGVWWVENFDFDAIRVDTVKHVPPDFFAEQWIPALRSARPSLFLLGEVWVEGSFEAYDTYLQTGFDSLFNFSLRSALVNGLAKDQGLEVVARIVGETVDHHGIDRALLLTNMLDNHDVPRFTTELEGDDEEDRLARYHLALVTLFGIPGIPQLYYGNEIGLFGGNDPDNRRKLPDWAFSPAERAKAQEGVLGTPERTHSLVRSLGRIRRQHPALWRGTYVELYRPNPGTPELFAFYRGTRDDAAVVVVHAGRQPVTVELDLLAPAQGQFLPEGMSFVDALGGIEPRALPGGRIELTLPGRSAAIFVPR